MISFKISQWIFSFIAIYQTDKRTFFLNFLRLEIPSQWNAGLQDPGNWILRPFTFFRSLLDSWVSIVEALVPHQ